MKNDTDRIVKTVLLRAPLERVWRAIVNAGEFGAWFGAEFDGPFVAGEKTSGRIRPTQVDAEVAKMQEPYAGMACDFMIERIEPMGLFSFRWHPCAIEPGADYAKEPTTLIEFVLEETAEGVQLTITESGFDNISLARRADAFAANESGWQGQTMLIGKYLAQAA